MVVPPSSVCFFALFTVDISHVNPGEIGVLPQLRKVNGRYIYNYIYFVYNIYSIHGFSNPISLSGGYHLVGRSDITIIPVELEKQDTIPVSHDIPTVMARNTSYKYL